MATHTTSHQGVQVVERQGENLWDKVKDFFSPVTDVLDIYIKGPMSIDSFRSDYRANLSVRERAEFDAALLGLYR